MFVPRATWGAKPLTEVGVTSQREGVFEKWISSTMTAPIVGSLAGVGDPYSVRRGAVSALTGALE